MSKKIQNIIIAVAVIIWVVSGLTLARWTDNQVDQYGFLVLLIIFVFIGIVMGCVSWGNKKYIVIWVIISLMVGGVLSTFFHYFLTNVYDTYEVVMADKITMLLVIDYIAGLIAGGIIVNKSLS